MRSSIEQTAIGYLVLRTFFWVFVMVWVSYSVFPWIREYLLIIFR